jgi:amino acid adenylation domain-containing protein
MLRRAWQQVANRHQPLRTLFKWAGRDKPLQIVLRHVALPWKMHDLVGLSPAAQQEALEIWLAEDRRRGFDLARPPLIRLNLFKMADNAFELVWSFHHIILGGWSGALVLKEVFSSYHAFCCGQEIELTPNRPYRDYIVWLQQQDLSPAESYWRETLQGFASPTSLAIERMPADIPPDEAQGPAQQSWQISASVTAALHNLRRQHGLTLNTIFQGAWAILLSRYSGDDDVVFGTTVSGRPAELRDVESMVGLFINTLPVRVRLFPGDVLVSWLKDLQNQQLALRQYEYSPLVEVHKWSDVVADTPLFESILVFENYPVDTIKAEISQPEAGEVKILDIRDIELTHYPLAVVIMPGETLSIQISYNRRRFEPAAVSRLGGHLQTILASMTREPCLADVSLLTEPEQNQLLVAWNNTQTNYPRNRCIHHLFEIQAETTPQAVAVVFRDKQLAYQALNQRANQVAHYLRKLGVGPETPVGLCVERSLEMVVGILAILKAGGSYVPLDPGYPPERLRYMFENSEIPVLLTQQALVAHLPADDVQLVCLDADWTIIAAEREDNLDSQVDAKNLAYIMYTSGSTGQPKGTSIMHRSVVRLVKETNYAKFFPTERFLQLAPISFDAATLEIWAPLLNGGQLVIFPPHTPSLLELAQVIQVYQISTLWLTTGLFNQMAEAEPESLNVVRQLLTGGDVVSPAHARRVLEQRKSGTLSNCYGPTENTTFSTYYPMTQPDQVGPSVSIGRPIANTQVYVLDRYFHPVPIGIPGELYLGGDGLARDYWRQPALTAERFVPNPFNNEPGARLYKTGDLARYLPDGNIEFLGRIDSQVKIRGFRIEPGEIEAVLGQHPAVRDAVVVLRQNATGEKRLVAYVVPRPALTPTSNDLRDFLMQKLPEYMIPSAFVLLDRLPLTPNGKVDKNKLPFPNDERSDLEEMFVAPRSWTEERLAEIWADLLGVARVGVHDNFFKMGGHSLLAVSLMARIQKQFQQDLPLSVLFEATNVENLAVILQKTDNRPQSSLVPIQSSGSRPPLFFVHPVGGNVLCYADLARCLGPEQPFYGLQSPGLNGELPLYARIEDLAAYYLELLRPVQPEGPYFLGGWSMGGIVAFEMAQQLHRQGQPVALLALLDSGLPSVNHDKNIELNDAKLLLAFITDWGRTLAKDVHITYNDMQGLSAADQLAYIYQQARSLDLLPPDVDLNQISRLFEVFITNYRAMIAYVPQTYAGPITHFQADESEAGEFDWRKFSAQPIKIYSVPGDHYNMIVMPQVKILARQLQSCLGQTKKLNNE